MMMSPSFALPQRHHRDSGLGVPTQVAFVRRNFMLSSLDLGYGVFPRPSSRRTLNAPVLGAFDNWLAKQTAILEFIWAPRPERMPTRSGQALGRGWPQSATFLLNQCICRGFRRSSPAAAFSRRGIWCMARLSSTPRSMVFRKALHIHRLFRLHRGCWKSSHAR